MAITSESTTVWTGNLASGSGTTCLDSSGVGEFAVNWKARSAGEANTSNPEELLAAAHSSCFSMQLSHLLTQFGTPPLTIQVTCAVTFDPDAGITGSHLLLQARVPGLDETDFQRIADEAKTTCPISRALAGIPLTLEATLA